MGVPRIGEWKEEGADLGLFDHWQDVRERHVTIVWPFVIPPADMETNAVARDVFERLVDRCDDPFDKAEEIAERPVLVREVTLERQVGTVELQQEAVLDNGLVFGFERSSERVEIT